MIGAIIGDIVGSRFEFNNHRSKEFELFADDCKATDDSIMTLAIAKAIMETDKVKAPSDKVEAPSAKGNEPSVSCSEHDSDYYALLSEMTVKYMQEIGRKYPHCGYGGSFARWVFSDDPKPYNSYGNGAAMRISPAGYAARTEEEAIRLSESITRVTHNHLEGIKGAEATAVAIFMARRGSTRKEIRDKIDSRYYPIDFTTDEIRGTYAFNETCQDTVPQAIAAFLESTSFEDAIRIAISIGGDSDTVAAITGSIAGAYYGVPEDIKGRALTYLDDELRRVYEEWTEFAGSENTPGKFKPLTKYISKISDTASFGEWFIDRQNDGTMEHPIQMPYVNYNEVVNSFVREFTQYSESHPEYQLTKYGSTLEGNGIHWGNQEMHNANIDSLDEKCILALIMGAIRAERFCDGALLSIFKDGTMLRWLKRLESIDAKEYDEEDICDDNDECDEDYDYEEVLIKKLTIDFYRNTRCDAKDLENDLFCNYTESLAIDNVKNQLVLKQIFSEDCAVTHQYDVQDGMDGILQDAAACFEDDTSWVDTAKPEDTPANRFYKLSAEYYDGTVISHSGIYSRCNIPEKPWIRLIRSILHFVTFYGSGELLDTKLFSSVGKDGEVKYCSVTFDGGGRSFYYQTNDESIAIGDNVSVPFGAADTVRIAFVENVEYFPIEKVPFPLEKTKTIIGKIDSE